MFKVYYMNKINLMYNILIMYNYLKPLTKILGKINYYYLDIIEN